jgi:diaminobutyrate-2-oxoglutarate transaminase
MNIFETLESNVQSYAQSFPVTFSKAKDSFLYDEKGNEYLDFLAGCGSLNYGHNNIVMKEALMEYIDNDGIAHGLDMHTEAKAKFMTLFDEYILKPRSMEYRLQFPGPTGTNAVEAALKIARKQTGRHNIISFTNGFHGATLGAVAATGNSFHREGAAVPLGNVTRMPFCGYHGQDTDTLKIIDKMLSDPSSGIDHPAAMITETVQGEGGLNVAAKEWLKGLEKICRKHEILLIVDEIQTGCGRTGTFFSFEPSGIKPDIITLSKSLSGYGIPLALVLIRPDLDIWEPGEHNGTFRGNNHAFVTAAAAINHYWNDNAFSEEIQDKAKLVNNQLKQISDGTGVIQLRPKGRGMIQGLQCKNGTIARKITETAFRKNLIMETSGSEGQVLKCLCPLTISRNDLEDGLNRLSESINEVLKNEVRLVS